MRKGLDQDFLDEFAPRWWAAWNDRDAEAIAPWHFRGTHAGDFVPMGFKATGGVLEVDGVDHWWFRDGRICRHRAKYDFAEAMRSIGATTPV